MIRITQIKCLNENEIETQILKKLHISKKDPKFEVLSYHKTFP